MRLALTEENRRWWVLATLVGSLAMIFVDQTVVGVALPSIQRDLELSTPQLHWIVNAYLVAFASFVALGGRVADVVGRVQAFRAGAALFLAGSALCGLAAGEEMLVACRALQGIGAAIMTPASGALVLNAFAPAERGRAMGIYASISMAFLAIGPLAGGVLTATVSWRAVFFVNVPIGAVMLALGRRTLRPEPGQGGHVDWPGIPLILLGLGCLTGGLTQARAWGWGSPGVIALLAAAVVLLAALVAWERRLREPLVALRLFAGRNFTADCVVIAAVQLGVTAVAVFGAIWVQDVLGYGPVAAGLSLLPVMLPMALLAPRTGHVYDRVGPRLPAGLGALAVALGLAGVALALSQRSVAWLVPGYLLLGAGVAFVMPAANTDAMNVAPAADRSQASGVVQTTRQVGATLGVAVLGAIIANVEFSGIASVLREHAAPAPVARVEALERSLGAATSADPSAAVVLIPGLVDDLQAAVTSAVATGLWVAAGVAGVAALLGLALLRHERASDDARPSEHHAHHLTG